MSAAMCPIRCRPTYSGSSDSKTPPRFTGQSAFRDRYQADGARCHGIARRCASVDRGGQLRQAAVRRLSEVGPGYIRRQRNSARSIRFCMSEVYRRYH
jgi:hypothetical protein